MELTSDTNGVSAEQPFEDIGIVVLQTISKFIDVKHIWRKSLCTHANRKLWRVLTQVA